MKDKGINALEIVFAMFILIVVTLIVLRLFTTTVTKESLPNVEDFRRAYNYDKEKAKCESRCSAFTTTGCSDLSAAVMYCQEKIMIDIDGNFRVNEKGHGGIVAGVPYCEDGLYCFHINECACGSYVLDPENCLKVMMDYYTRQMGLSEFTAYQIILNNIKPGECDRDPARWGRRFYEGYTPIRLPDAECQEYRLDYPCNLPADWWWWKAGYGEIYEQLIESGSQQAGVLPTFLFACSPSGNNINCRWFGCPTEGEIVILLNDGSFYKDMNKPIGSFNFGPLKPGSYSVILVCGEKTANSGPITIE
jgi:hypothetical protein